MPRCERVLGGSFVDLSFAARSSAWGSRVLDAGVRVPRPALQLCCTICPGRMMKRLTSCGARPTALLPRGRLHPRLHILYWVRWCPEVSGKAAAGLRRRRACRPLLSSSRVPLRATSRSRPRAVRQGVERRLDRVSLDARVSHAAAARCRADSSPGRCGERIARHMRLDTYVGEDDVDIRQLFAECRGARLPRFQRAPEGGARSPARGRRTRAISSL